MALVIIRSTAPYGHFRAGRKFGREASVFDLTDEELDLVRADVRLVIEAEPKAEPVSSPSTSAVEVPAADVDSSKAASKPRR